MSCSASSTAARNYLQQSIFAGNFLTSYRDFLSFCVFEFHIICFFKNSKSCSNSNSKKFHGSKMKFTTLEPTYAWIFTLILVCAGNFYFSVSLPGRKIFFYAWSCVVCKIVILSLGYWSAWQEVRWGGLRVDKVSYSVS